MSDKFKYNEYFGDRHWWNYDMSGDYGSHIDDLKSIASYYGYSDDDIDDLLEQGFTPDEIEEYIYCSE